MVGLDHTDITSIAVSLTCQVPGPTKRVVLIYRVGTGCQRSSILTPSHTALQHPQHPKCTLPKTFNPFPPFSTWATNSSASQAKSWFSYSPSCLFATSPPANVPVGSMKNYIEDLSPPGLSTCDFMESLKKWEKAWLTFSVGKEVAAQTTYIPYRGRSDVLLRSGYLIEMRHGEAPGFSYLDLSSQRIVNGVQSSLGWTDIQLAANASIGGWALDVD